ncbi:hypothetical protein PYW07_001609 [Mythimna separata]|uniref:Peptidase S1 domain-containing protein n=1 Tax=Mythimna separata TaxID=271217 RepID=A0AAD8DW15_MYTSE|nr:hypothetical protein PYW07_001609 [Mythimna separata]
MVTSRHAVTSASCVHDRVGNGQFVVINATEYRVFAGSFNLSDNSVDRNRNVEKITVHPDYRPNTPYVNDIAVITLDGAFPNSVVATISLAVSESNTTHGSICQAAGWGSQNGTSSASTQMMYRSKTVFDQAVCKGLYSLPASGFTQINLEDSMMCALNPLSPSCEGDLGNPLVCNGWYLTGILVHHRGDCNTNTSSFPEVYTRISSFRSWIERTSGASTFQPGMAVLGLICIVQIVTAKVLQ